MRKKHLIIKSNELKSSFEAINLPYEGYLNKNFESLYKNRLTIRNFLQKVDLDEKSE